MPCDVHCIFRIMVVASVTNICMLCHASRIVYRCPTDKREWESARKTWVCQSAGETYHCLQRSDGKLVELCFLPRSLPSKGLCPVLNYTSKIPLRYKMGITKCKGRQTECPYGTQGDFSSDELYRYPGCWHEDNTETPQIHESTTEEPRGTEIPNDIYELPNNDRTQHLKDIIKSSIHPTPRLASTPPRRKIQKVIESSVNEETFIRETLSSKDIALLTGGVIGTTVIIGLVILVGYLCKRIRGQMEEAKYFPAVPYNATETHPYSDIEMYDDIMVIEQPGGSDEYIEPINVETEGKPRAAKNINRISNEDNEEQIEFFNDSMDSEQSSSSAEYVEPNPFKVDQETVTMRRNTSDSPEEEDKCKSEVYNDVLGFQLYSSSDFPQQHPSIKNIAEKKIVKSERLRVEGKPDNEFDTEDFEDDRRGRSTKNSKQNIADLIFGEEAMQVQIEFSGEEESSDEQFDLK